MSDIRSTFDRQGLIRPMSGRILGGVCAGLGRRFGLTPWTTRLLFVLLLMVVPGSQLLIYPVLWILMPIEGRGQALTWLRLRGTGPYEKPITGH